MLGILSSQRPTLGVLFSRRSTLVVPFPHKPMNMSGHPNKKPQQDGKADQEDASHPGLTQLSSIDLHPRGPDLLREQLNKKRRASQVTPHCRCERIIASVLADCTCSSLTQTKSVFERLFATSSD